jgi:hypothetical protein
MSVKNRIAELNARLADTLTEKGIDASADETTTALIGKVAQIEQGKETLDLWFRNCLSPGILTGTEITEFGDLEFPLATDLVNFLSQNKAVKNVGNMEAPNATSAVAMAKLATAIETIGYIHAPKLSNTGSMFMGSSIKKFGGLIGAKLNHVANMFWQCANLEEVTEPLDFSDVRPYNMAHELTHLSRNIKKMWFVEESIGFGLSLSTSCDNLEIDCLKSLIMGLKNYSGTDNAYVYTLTLQAGHKQKLEEDGATAPNGMTWEEYVYSKGWNY